MSLHADFVKIKRRFVKQFGDKRGGDKFSKFLEKRGLNSSHPFPKGTERKEKQCAVRGIEFKEVEGVFHIKGLIATSHIDLVDHEEGFTPGEDIPDYIPRETLDSFAQQMNTRYDARVMGVHHSEGKTGEYFGVSDVDVTPVTVVDLADGESGLYVDTKMLETEGASAVIEGFEKEEFHSFSITYDTNGYETVDFGWQEDRLVRILQPETQIFGYTAATAPVNPNAVATEYGYKEFKELMKLTKQPMEEDRMAKQEDKKEVKEQEPEAPVEQPEVPAETPVETPEVPAETPEVPVEKPEETVTLSEKEAKEFRKLAEDRESKEFVEKVASKVLGEVDKKMEMKEKVLNQEDDDKKDLPREFKEFREILEGKEIGITEQFRRAGALADLHGLHDKPTSSAESREYKNFATNGRELEYKGLGITTNKNTDTDYLQSTAELQDVYDPIIYNALNQATLTWNVLAKDDYSRQGNNQVQFTLKTTANTSAAFYTGNAVVTGNVGRLKYQTKFKKIQVGVSVDGDMIAAAKGGPVGDVFAQEVEDSTMDMLAVLNVALYAEVGLETVAGPIGFEYISDSAGNTSLYNLTRSAANKLAPDSAGDTYIDNGAGVVQMVNLRALIRQATTDGAPKRELAFFTSPTQGDMLRGKFDDQKRHRGDKETRFGFSTDLFVDSVPVFEDKDCNTDDWFLVPMDSHRIGIWIPPTIERLGKTGDSEDAFVKMYFAVYNRRPRALGQLYNCATS